MQFMSGLGEKVWHCGGKIVNLKSEFSQKGNFECDIFFSKLGTLKNCKRYFQYRNPIWYELFVNNSIRTVEIN